MTEKRRPIITRRVDKTNLKISVWPSQHGYQLSLQNSWKKKDSDEWTNVTISAFQRQAAKQEQRNQEPLPGFGEGEDLDEIPFG